jgi:hypothetical protein
LVSTELLTSYTEANYPTGYRVYKNVNGGWQSVASSQFGTNSVDIPVANSSGRYKLTAYNSSGDSYGAPEKEVYTFILNPANYVESGSGGTYKRNGTNVGTTLTEAYLEGSNLVTIEAINPPEYGFYMWSDGSEENPRPINPNANKTLTANYKKHFVSSIPSATASSNQRKMVYYNGVSYLVYESGGEIWLTSSANEGVSWTNEKRLSDGTSLNRQPSIATSYLPGGGLGVIWERYEPLSGPHGTGCLSVQMRLSDESTINWGASKEVYSEFVPEDFAGSTPVLAISPNYVTVAFSACNFEGEGGVYFNFALYTSNQIGNFTYNTQIGYMHPGFPSLLTKPIDPWTVGIAWKDWYTIYYQEFSTYTQNFGEIEAVDYMLPATGGPSLAYDLSTTACNPIIAWQIMDDTYAHGYMISFKKRGDSGWNTPRVLYGGYENFYNPTVVYGGNSQCNIALVWHNYSNVYQAKYTTIWQPAQYRFAGKFPSLRWGGSTTVPYLLTYMSGNQAPYPVNSTNQGFIGRHEEEKIIADQYVPLHRLDFLHNNSRHSIIINAAVGVSDKKDPINFKPEKKSLNHVSLSESFDVTSGMSIALEVDYGNKKVDEKKEAVHVDLPLELEIVDAVTDANLSKLPLGMLDVTHPSKVYQLDLSSLAGRRVKISLNSSVWQTDSVKVSQATMFFNSNVDSLRLARGKEIQRIVLEIPKEYNLAQNYPNPFNPSTAIQFSLKSPSSVTLEVFDVLGRKVVTLVNEQKSAGMHTVRWDASRVSSGLYFYKINVVGENGRMEYQKTLKMLVMK